MTDEFRDGRFETIASAPTPPDRVGEEVGRDHVVSARLIPWEPGSLGGVDLTFESGLRVALPLSASEAAPSPDPAGAGGDLGTGSDLLDALHRVARAAKAMPRETPAPGGAGTMHSFSIEAGVVWDLDWALDHLAVIQAGYSTGKYRSGKLVASTGSGEETKGEPPCGVGLS